MNAHGDAVPLGRLQDDLLRLDDLRVALALAGFMAQTHGEIRGSDIDGADPRDVEDRVEVIDGLPCLDLRNDQRLLIGENVVVSPAMRRPASIILGPYGA